MLCWAVRQLGAVMFTAFFSQYKLFFIWHLHITWHVGRASIDVIYWYVSLSGFLIVLPYLVMTMFSPFCIPLLSTLVLFNFFACIPAHCLVDCFLLVVYHICFGLSLLLFWVILLEYDCGLILMCSRTTSSGSVCLYVFFLGNVCNPLLLLISAWYVVYYM